MTQHEFALNQLWETGRHNRATEAFQIQQNKINAGNLDELRRSNFAREAYNTASLEETHKENLRRKQMSTLELRESQRHNSAVENENHRTNVAKEVISIGQREAQEGHWKAEEAVNLMNANTNKLVLEENVRSHKASEALTLRGQDINAQVTMRGQDISSATAIRGQDVSKSIAELNAATAIATNDARIAAEKDIAFSKQANDLMTFYAKLSQDKDLTEAKLNQEVELWIRSNPELQQMYEDLHGDDKLAAKTTKLLREWYKRNATGWGDKERNQMIEQYIRDVLGFTGQIGSSLLK